MPLPSSVLRKAGGWTLVLLLGITQAGAPAPLLAQGSAACDGPRFRDFDYWTGTWAVENVEGDRVGSNTISAVSGGCALFEQWDSVEGTTGMSINHYDPARERWEQLWVGSGGLILRLAGQLEDGVMVLTSTESRDTPRGSVVDRISWVPEVGTVRQLWEISLDDGESWQTVFEGIYRPAEPSSARASPAADGGDPPDGLRQLRERWSAAYQAGDSGAMVNFYTPDAVRMPYDAPAQEGRNAILATYESSFLQRGFVPEIELLPMNVRVIDGEAVEYGRYREVLRPRRVGRALLEEGKYLSIARPADDGTWRYSLSIFNRDAPAAPLDESE